MIKIETLEGFIKEVDSLPHKELFYRGENRKFDKRSPSIYQYPSLQANSSDYYNRLLAEMPSAKSEDLFFTIANLQHYGAKTRFLDVTSNALIGLFFASLQQDENGYVYVYHSENVKFDTGHTALMKSAINFLNSKLTMDFIKECNPKKEQDFLEKLREVISTQNWVGKPDQIREDLKKAHIVIATKKSDRIIRQAGNFIIPTFEYKENAVNKSISELSLIDIKKEPIIFEIPKENKHEILKDLAKVGIHQGSVYPDVENQTNYLKDFYEDFPSKISNSDTNSLKQEIIEQYKAGEILIKSKSAFTGAQGTRDLTVVEEFLSGFHTCDSVLVTEADDYFAGIRADHFVVEIGYSEQTYGDDEAWETQFALITGNHKGTRLITVVRLKNK